MLACLLIHLSPANLIIVILSAIYLYKFTTFVVCTEIGILYKFNILLLVSNSLSSKTDDLDLAFQGH